MNIIKLTAVCGALAVLVGGAQAIEVTNNIDAAALAAAIAGEGVTISNAVLTSNTVLPSGTFTGGAASVGFGSGIVLTTGTTGCVAGPNNQGGCTGGGNSTSLKFDFESTTGQVFFKYVFASEEYNEFVNSGFNDSFKLLLNGINIAELPGGAGVVEINNVNCGENSAFYVNNSSGPAGCVNQNLDIQYDGLTTVLTATGDLLVGVNTFEFLINDVGDSILDSGVFIEAGSFCGVNCGGDVPEPGSLALAGLALAGLAAARRRKL